MSSFNVKITGGKALEKALRQLPEKVERSIVKGAVRAGARLILLAARRNVPVAEGSLLKSIDIKDRRVKSGAMVSVLVRRGTSRGVKGVGHRAHIIEFGSKNQAAQPIMRPAMDSEKVNAIKAMAAYIQKRIGKLAAGF